MTVIPFRTDDDVAAALPLIRDHLHAGGLLAYPTETVYGLGSRPYPSDIAALAALKGRPEGKPFLVLVGSRAMAEEWGLEFTLSASGLADAFWPGPLTLVLRSEGRRLPDALRGPEGGIAVRWTSHVHIAEMIRELGYPITSTSANRPGQPTAPGAGGVAEEFADAPTLRVLDGGVLGNVPPSTLVDCTAGAPKLIRAGAIPRGELRARVGSLAP